MKSLGAVLLTLYCSMKLTPPCLTGDSSRRPSCFCVLTVHSCSVRPSNLTPEDICLVREDSSLLEELSETGSALNASSERSAAFFHFTQEVNKAKEQIFSVVFWFLSESVLHQLRGQQTRLQQDRRRDRRAHRASLQVLNSESYTDFSQTLTRRVCVHVWMVSSCLVFLLDEPFRAAFIKNSSFLWVWREGKLQMFLEREWIWGTGCRGSAAWSL